jgi:hypothetical protein
MATQLGNALFAAQTRQNNADFFFCAEITAGLTPNIADSLVRLVFMINLLILFFAHLRLLRRLDKPKTSP